MIERGEIYIADLDPIVGSEQGGRRPVVVIQNNVGNKFSPTVIIAAITSNIKKSSLPTHIIIDGQGILKRSVILLEQIRTIDKRRLGKRLFKLTDEQMHLLDEALKVSVLKA